MTHSANTDPSAYAKPLPKLTPLNRPFWSFTRQHDLRFKRCLNCRNWIHPIAPHCQNCWSEEHEWERVSGKGIVTSWVTYHKAFEESFRSELPYTVIQVDLEENIRLISNFIDRDTRPHYGMKVKVAFDDITSEITLVKFQPDAA